jgi:hypothetical protein
MKAENNAFNDINTHPQVTATGITSFVTNMMPQTGQDEDRRVLEVEA